MLLFNVSIQSRQGWIASSACGYPGQISATDYFTRRPGVVGCYFSHLKAWDLLTSGTGSGHLRNVGCESPGNCPDVSSTNTSDNALSDVAIVFEDDILPKPAFSARMNNLTTLLPADWDVVLLHVKQSRFFTAKSGDPHHKVEPARPKGLRTWNSVLCPAFSAHGSRMPFKRMPFCVPASSLYMIRKSAAARVLREAAIPMITEIDGLFGLLSEGHPAVPGFLDARHLNVYMLNPELSPAFENSDNFESRSTIGNH